MPPDLLAPIPPWDEPDDWSRLPIVESGERLVALMARPEANLALRPLYFEQGVAGASETLYLRSGAAARLLSAAAVVHSYGATLVVFDGYRPLRVQEALRDACLAELRSEYPHATDSELRALVQQFVANPSADPACPPPHLTGGAVDVYLVHRETGAELPMGTAPDAALPESATRYYEADDARPFARNRRLLYHAMHANGFENYHAEWWHFDYGNQRWANVAIQPQAIYGPASPPAVSAAGTAKK